MQIEIPGCQFVVFVWTKNIPDMVKPQHVQLTSVPKTAIRYSHFSSHCQLTSCLGINSYSASGQREKNCFFSLGSTPRTRIKKVLFRWSFWRARAARTQGSKIINSKVQPLAEFEFGGNHSLSESHLACFQTATP